MQQIKTYNDLKQIINKSNKKSNTSEINIVKILKEIEGSEIWKKDDFYQNKNQKSKIKNFNDLLLNLNIALGRYLNIKHIISLRNGKTVFNEWGYSNAVEWSKHKKEIQKKIIDLAKNHLKENQSLIKEAINFNIIYKAEIAKKYKSRQKIFKSKNINKEKLKKRNGYNDDDFIDDILEKENNTIKCSRCEELEKENKKLKKQIKKLKSTIDELLDINKA